MKKQKRKQQAQQWGSSLVQPIHYKVDLPVEVVLRQLATIKYGWPSYNERFKLVKDVGRRNDHHVVKFGLYAERANIPAATVSLIATIEETEDQTILTGELKASAIHMLVRIAISIFIVLFGLGHTILSQNPNQILISFAGPLFFAVGYADLVFKRNKVQQSIEDLLYNPTSRKKKKGAAKATPFDNDMESKTTYAR